MPKTVLVTGGSGRLGNYIALHLKKEGYNVATFDVVPPKPDSYVVQERIPFTVGNLTSPDDVLRACVWAQPDIIAHVGAITHPTDIMPPYPKDGNIKWGRTSYEMPEQSTFEINTMGTFYVFDAARRLGIKQVILASSYFSIGIGFRLSGKGFEPEYLPIDEDHPCWPEDSYSLSKYFNEETGKAFARAYGIKVQAMRLLGMYYENNEMSSRNHKFNVTVPAATETDKGLLMGDTFQYADARDVAIFVRLAIEKVDSLSPYEAFFLSTDTKYTEPTAVIAARRWPFLAEKAKDIPGTEGIISIKKAERLLGWKPQHSWRNKA
jgi:nucleoside-diphosphate-sugar epimerase